MKNFPAILLLCALCCPALRLQAQVNLVPNPSFEDTSGCPMGYPDLEGKCNDWMSFRITPDYFHNCSLVCGYQNNWGYQKPHTGKAYTGIVTYHEYVTNAREHIGVELLSPLSIGTKYYITYYISLAYTPLQMNIAISKMGALVTTSPYKDSLGTGILPNASTIVEDSITRDTLNWVKISGSFIADSAYQYLIIGNFFDDNNIDTIHLPYSVVPQMSYYYIDDVCLSTDSIYAHTWTGYNEIQEVSNEISIHPIPVSYYINIESSEPIDRIAIYNSFGQVVFAYHSNNDLQKINLPISNLKPGIYFIRTKTCNKLYLNKLIVKP